MKRIYLLAGAAFAIVALAIAAVLLLTGPHMVDQPSFKTYEELPLPPAPGAVSLEAPPALAATTAFAPADTGNLDRGRIDYSYYCVFCHGQLGKGDGPVGESYVPKPADLTATTWAGVGPADMAMRMLTGHGHEPVLERVVPAEEIPHLALFIRSLSANR